MKKATVFFLAAMICAAVAMVGLAACSGSTASSSAASSASSSASSSSASSAASSAASSSSSTSSDAILTIDGVDIKKIDVDMVGDTPNFSLVFANNTDKDVDVDLSKFQIKRNDQDEVSFHLTKKTIGANKPYVQWAMSASPGSLKAGDSVTVYYDGKLVGTYEVTSF